MKLRQRVLLAIGATTVALIGGIYVLSSSLLLTNYIELEKREVRQDVDRIRDAMHGQAEDLHRTSLDWSNWDETYDFLKNRKSGYIATNLGVITLKLDMMLFLDSKGRIHYSRPIPRTKGVAPPDPVKVRHALGFDKPEGYRNPRREVSGFIRIGGQLCVATARPVLPSEGNKPPNGWIVWVLYFDKAEATSLSNRLHLGFNAFTFNDPALPSDSKRIIAALHRSPSPITQPVNDETVTGYGLINDVAGNSVAMVRLSESRAIYKQGVEGVKQLVALVILAALIFSLVFIAVIDSFALRRILSLRSQVESIGDRDDGANVYLSGSDELSWLSRAIQGMVSKLRDKGEELRQNHDRLQETVSKLASANSVLEHAVEGIARVDHKGRISATNVSFAKNLGYRRGELCEQPWQTIVHPHDHGRFAASLIEAQESGKASIEIQACRHDKALFFAEVVIVATDRPGGKSEGFHVFMKDISERKWLETRIEHQAFHDNLTGLPNRAKFMDRLNHAIIRAKRRESGVAVVFMDLDNFKIVNDSLGHDVGDLLLIKIAERLKECLREEDTIARLGGDEFTVLLQDLDGIERATEVAERIVEALSVPINLPHCEMVAMASIGISFSMAGDEMPESLLRDADTAMYAAKARGKSGYAVFDPSMNQQVVERMELEMGMRRALERGEFTLEYQPIVCLQTGDIDGIEALLRWDDPVKGRISPEKFIPVAEDSGLIVPIGAWVLREACLEFRKLQEEFSFPTRFTLSVNVSGRQLQRPDTVGQIVEILKETGMDPDLLKLEVTESVLIRDEVESVEKLREIKDLGIKIAIDDFGTGYSSLSSLNSSPVDVVKIDRTFISRMGKEEEVDAIVGAIILLSKVMQLEVTAEGIETREQVQYLQAFGCSLAQGFYFSCPLTPADLRGLLSRGMNVSISLEKEYNGIINPILAA